MDDWTKLKGVRKFWEHGEHLLRARERVLVFIEQEPMCLICKPALLPIFTMSPP
jgi:hypothetical protein